LELEKHPIEPEELINKKEVLLDQVTQEESVRYLKENTFAFRKLMACYRCAMMEVETKFNVLNEEFSLLYDHNPIKSINSRLKAPVSIAEKLRRRGLPVSCESVEENLSDVAGVRIICPFPEDVYMLEEALLRQDDLKLIERKDYIAKPKENGYRSLHLIVEVPIFLMKEKRYVRVEIQFRTIAMDFWASLEHQLKYKKNRPEEEELNMELKMCADVSAALDRRMNDLRKQIESNPAKWC